MKQAVFVQPTANGTPYSPAVKVGNQLYVSGQLPIDPCKGMIPDSIYEQTCLCLERIRDLVEKAGFEMQDIVKTTVYMTDFSEFSQMNEAYMKYFSQPYPARCACEVSALAQGASVEIDCVAIQE